LLGVVHGLAEHGSELAGVLQVQGVRVLHSEPLHADDEGPASPGGFPQTAADPVDEGPAALVRLLDHVEGAHRTQDLGRDLLRQGGAGHAQHRQPVQGQGPGVRLPLHQEEGVVSVQAVEAVQDRDVALDPAAPLGRRDVGADPLRPGLATGVLVRDHHGPAPLEEAPLAQVFLRNPLRLGQPDHRQVSVPLAARRRRDAP